MAEGRDAGSVEVRLIIEVCDRRSFSPRNIGVSLRCKFRFRIRLDGGGS